MASVEDLTAQLFRLVHLTRSAAMKRALTAVDPEPKLNFWRLVLGNQLDVAVLEWCKVFGSHTEATHWKKVVPTSQHDHYRASLQATLGIGDREWTDYWEEMKTYRDNLVAHHFEANKVQKFPSLDLALRSGFFHYKYVLAELKSLVAVNYPDDLSVYYDDFEAQAREIAKVVLCASSGIRERVQ